MGSLPPAVRLKCASILAAPIQSIENISGGDINEARLIKTEGSHSHQPGASYFLKMNSLPQSLHMFETEAKGLQLIQQSKSIATPKVISFGKADDTAFLLLSYIAPAPKTDSFWENFGHSLAQFHRDNTHSQFGLDHDNFIGSLNQVNHFEKDWQTFYIKQRIAPQLKLAIDTGKMNRSRIQSFDKLFNKLNELLPIEPASLTHGDLWNGNFLVNQEDQAILIDPAVCYAHREMDLAMTHLFGGFSQTFYDTYQATYPLEKGFQKRMDIYQLYYLLVHVNLFGGSYVNSVNHIVQKYQ